MKTKKIIVSTILFLGTVFVISCKTQKKVTEEACVAPAPTYSANIKSIIESKCAVEGCHSRGRGDFRVFENFKRKADAGEVMDKVVINKSMPPNGALPANEIQQINCWLKNGSKEN